MGDTVLHLWHTILFQILCADVYICATTVDIHTINRECLLSKVYNFYFRRTTKFLAKRTLLVNLFQFIRPNDGKVVNIEGKSSIYHAVNRVNSVIGCCFV